MRIIRTDETNPNYFPDQQEKDWVYNGLDCCITLEVLNSILPQIDDTTSETYRFSKALQGPALEMRLRGVLVDQRRKQEVIDEFYDHIDRLEMQLEQIVLDGVGLHTFNWRSNPDLHNLFYNHLQIPPIRRGGKPTVNRDALEKMEVYLVAKPIIAHSSSFSEFGTGGNLQNVEESLRSIFVPDPGYKFAKFDAKSGESFIVGAIEWNLFDDPRYLEACESGDPHTAVARICWPSLPWTGDLKRDKHIAEAPYYRHYSYRYMCKKLGHGSNYAGQSKTLATQTRLPETVVRDFQPKYFRAFPSHIRWHGWVDTQLRTVGNLTTLTGRKRWFFGRRNDPSTFREAVAYDPQGSLADIVNRAMLRIWRKRTAILMMQDHDALTFMYPEETEDEIIPAIQADLVEEIPLKNGRTLRIPYDCKVGWNKGDVSKTNPDGLKDYQGHDERQRTPKVSILDRMLHRSHG